jgi:MFS family permease
MPHRDVATRFVRWTCMRAVFHRGYWLVTSLYLVVDADLSAFQLVFLGTAQGLTALACEVPTGVMADTISRKWSIVISHLVMGVGMLATGLVTGFPALVVTQMLWGLGWTFASGAEVAWVTDELDRPDRIAAVLTASARWQQVGAAGGMVGFGALAWATDSPLRWWPLDSPCWCWGCSSRHDSPNTTSPQRASSAGASRCRSSGAASTLRAAIPRS